MTRQWLVSSVLAAGGVFLSGSRVTAQHFVLTSEQLVSAGAPDIVMDADFTLARTGSLNIRVRDYSTDDPPTSISIGVGRAGAVEAELATFELARESGVPGRPGWWRTAHAALDPATTHALLARPSDYFVVVRTALFPEGRARGQAPTLLRQCLRADRQAVGVDGSIVFDAGVNRATWSLFPPSGAAESFTIRRGAPDESGEVVLSFGFDGPNEFGGLTGSGEVDAQALDEVLLDPGAFTVELTSAGGGDTLRCRLFEPAREWDVNYDCAIGADDLSHWIGQWGAGFDSADLAQVLGSWGPTP